MYLKLLNEAVLEEEGKKVEPPPECAVSVKADAFIPKSYVTDAGQRMEMYKKIARIADDDDFDDVIDEFCDRFGDIPSPVLSLCTISLVRATGAKCGVSKIDQVDRTVTVVPSKPDPFVLTDLVSKFPRGSVNLHLAGSVAAVFRIPKDEKGTDGALRVMRAYDEACKETKEETV